MSSFSIKWLLLVVAYVAVAIAALLNANDYWRNALHAASLLLVLAAILGTIYSVGQRRAFWTGWLVFGAAWFLPVFGNHEFLRALNPRLITNGFREIHGHLFSPTIEIVANEELDAAIERANKMQGDVRTLSDNRHQLTLVQPAQRDFTAVGEAVLCIPFAFLGAIIATWFWRKRESERALRPG
jgi:hypothetical protein